MVTYSVMQQLNWKLPPYIPSRERDPPAWEGALHSGTESLSSPRVLAALGLAWGHGTALPWHSRLQPRTHYSSHQLLWVLAFAWPR